MSANGMPLGGRPMNEAQMREMQDGAIQMVMNGSVLGLNVIRGAPDEIELRAFHPAGWRIVLPLNRDGAEGLRQSLGNALAWLAEEDAKGTPAEAEVATCSCGQVMTSMVLRQSHREMGHEVPE